jgi:hypothetical protein
MTRDLILSHFPRPGLMYHAATVDNIMPAGAAAHAHAAAMPSDIPP